MEGRPSRVDELKRYRAATAHPLDVLKCLQSYRLILEAFHELTAAVRPQMGLFESPAEALETDIRALLPLKAQGKQFYNRYEREVRGKMREISTPTPEVERVLRSYVLPIVRLAPSHEACHNESVWTPQKSVSHHLPLDTLFSFDISSAHRNTNAQVTFDFFHELVEKTRFANEATEIAGFLTDLTTVHYDRTTTAPQAYGQAQGSPVSNALFNRIMYPVDVALADHARQNDFTYSRWGDDFMLASKASTDPNAFLEAIEYVRADFPIALHKIFLQRNIDEQPCYALGHKVLGRRVVKADPEEVAQRVPISPALYAEFVASKTPVPVEKIADVLPFEPFRRSMNGFSALSSIYEHPQLRAMLSRDE